MRAAEQGGDNLPGLVVVGEEGQHPEGGELSTIFLTGGTGKAAGDLQAAGGRFNAAGRGGFKAAGRDGFKAVGRAVQSAHPAD